MTSWYALIATKKKKKKVFHFDFDKIYFEFLFLIYIFEGVNSTMESNAFFCSRNLFVTSIIMILYAESVFLQPIRGGERKSCGRDLVQRVDRICSNRGGHLSMTSSPIRVRRGIVNECCMNKCPDHHLYLYCVNSKPETEPDDEEAIEDESNPSSLPDAQALVNQEAYETNVEASTMPFEYDVPAPDFASKKADKNDAKFPEAIHRIMEIVERQEKRPRQQFQFGTVPPEYQIMPIIPSRSRLVY